MDVIAKKHLTRTLVGALILLNIATLIALWLTYLRRPLPPPRRGGGGVGGGGADNVQAFFIRELGLTNEQVQKFEALRQKLISSVRGDNGKQRELRLALMTELLAPAPDRAKIDELTAALGRQEGEMDKQLFMHFRELYDACTPEQRVKFRGILGELLAMFGPPPPPK